MRFAFALIALGLVASLPATARAQTWDEYRPAGRTGDEGRIP